MSRYKNERFNYSHMSERITFQEIQPDHTYRDSITVWSHILKDGFTRTETDNWFKVAVRQQRALEPLLSVGNRIKWKKRTLKIFSWQDPSYEDRGIIEIMANQIVTDGATSAVELFKDVVSVYRMVRTESNSFGIISYKFTYNFNTPTLTNVRCSFATDANRYLEDKKTDTEHDALIVKFAYDSGIQVEDYIISPIHGKFKVDMIIANDDNTLDAYVKRGEVQ